MPPHEGVPGSLLWVRDDDLLAQPLDIEAGRLTGEVSTIASDVRVEESQRGTFASVSDNGRIVWASARAAKMSFAWYERSGRRIGDLPIEPGKIMQPRISPDGTKLAFTRASNGTADVWVHDFSSGVTKQVTTDPDYDEIPSWSPDGRQLIYQGSVKAKQSLLIAAVDGSKDPTPIALDEPAFGGRFMPDGHAVLFSVAKPSTGSDLKMASVERPDLRSDLISDPGQEVGPEPSPDGRWLTYMSDRTGRFEVVLARLIRDGMRFRLGQRVPVTSTGGMDPIWRKDGREIAYLAPDGTLMAVSVAIAGEGVTLGKPTPLFRLRSDAGGWGATWTATGDLTKFVIVEAPHAIGQRFQLLTNWMPGK